MTARIYCFANQKGGVAKTTTTVNLGACIAASGRRVLIVDVDPQSNATTSLGINPRTLEVSLYDVLIENRPVQEALTLTEWMNLDLLPSSTDLAGAEVEMAGLMARERLLSRSLAPLAEKYDYIFIDEPPSAAFRPLMTSSRSSTEFRLAEPPNVACPSSLWRRLAPPTLSL